MSLQTRAKKIIHRLSFKSISASFPFPIPERQMAIHLTRNFRLLSSRITNGFILNTQHSDFSRGYSWSSWILFICLYLNDLSNMPSFTSSNQFFKLFCLNILIVALRTTQSNGHHSVQMWKQNLALEEKFNWIYFCKNKSLK